MLEEKHPLKVFLCHAHSDKDKVHALYSRLRREGVDVWLDKEKLLPGSDWEYEIRKAVREADVVVVCLSKQFNQAGFRQKEVRLALDTAMEKPEGEIFIIPTRLEECDTLESLKRWHWVDLFEEDGYQNLIRALRARADRIGATLRIRKGGQLTGRNIEQQVQEMKPYPPEELPTRDIGIGSDVSGSVSVAGNNNVINLSDNKKETQTLARKSIEGVKQNRVLEAAIEKEVRVNVPASLFVWIRRQESKNIISVISSVDEDVTLDEESVKAKGLEIEFPIENGKVLPAGIILRLIAHEFNPSTQYKKINVPPEGDSEVCTFIVTPMKAGRLLLSLEVLKDEVSLATRTLRTTALETQKQVSSLLVVVSIPIIVLLQATTSGTKLLDEELKVKEKIEAEHAALEKTELEKAERERAESVVVEKAKHERKTRVCPTCGTLLSKNAMYCPVCGRALTGKTSPESKKATTTSIPSKGRSDKVVKTQIIVALIGAAATVITALLGSPILSVLSNKATPTTIMSISTKHPTPTQTFVSTATDTLTPTSTPTPTSTSRSELPIYVGQNLSPGFQILVDSSGGLRGWIIDEGGYMCTALPQDQSWGVVLIAVETLQPTGERQVRDLSQYQTLAIDLRGKQGGEVVYIGIQDKNDRSDGSETKFPITLTNLWTKYEFSLSTFVTADLTQIYIPVEFVVEPRGVQEEVCFRNIRYVK